MSISSSIDIYLVNNNKTIISPIILIEKFLNFGWTLNDCGKATYLPIGDDGNYDWQSESISKDSLMAILDEKEKLGEVIGISMTWENTNIGGSFLFLKNGEISISLIINRKSLGGMNNTDVSWYLTRIMPVFNQDDGILIESFSYEEYV